MFLGVLGGERNRWHNNAWTRVDRVDALSWVGRSIPEVVDCVLNHLSVKVHLHLDGFLGAFNIRFPCLLDINDEVGLVSLEHGTGLRVLIKSYLHNVLDLIWVDGNVEVKWDLWEGALEHWKLFEGEHRDYVCCMWVIVVGHVLLKLWDDVTELDSVHVHVGGDVSANILHGTDVDLPLSEDQVLPDVKVLLDDSRLIVLPSRPHSVEVSVAGSVLSLDVIPPSPDIMVVPLEGDVGWDITEMVCSLGKVLNGGHLT